MVSFGMGLPSTRRGGTPPHSGLAFGKGYKSHGRLVLCRRYYGLVVTVSLQSRGKRATVHPCCSRRSLCEVLARSGCARGQPRLVGATEKQRAEWELIGGGVGIHWEAVDEDISVASLLQPENLIRLPDKALRPASRAPRRGKKVKPPRPARV